MKQIMLFFMFSVFLTSSVYAQKNRGDQGLEQRMERHQENMKKIVDRIDEHVSLTTSQKQEIQVILEETTLKIREIEVLTEPQRQEVKAKIDEIRTSDLSRTEKREKIKEIREEYQPQIKEFREKMHSITEDSKQRINEILTVEQKAILYEVLTERKSKEKQKMKVK